MHCCEEILQASKAVLSYGKDIKLKVGESGSWYLLEKNGGVEKITAILVLWISAAHVIKRRIFAWFQENLQCLLGHRNKRSFTSA